jgi:hypothetical protein
MKKKYVKLVAKRPDETDLAMHQVKMMLTGYPQGIEPSISSLYQRKEQNKTDDKN